MPKGLDETEHIGESFQVETINGQNEHTIATDYKLRVNTNTVPFLEVWGDDDFEDGPIKLRVYNLNHVVEYGWSE